MTHNPKAIIQKWEDINNDNDKALPGYMTSTLPPERLAPANELFEVLDTAGHGKVDLMMFAAMVHDWEPDFSMDAVASTFKTCGAKKGILTRQPYYKWITKVWASLSDERYKAAMSDLLQAVLKATGRQRARSTSLEELSMEQLEGIQGLEDSDIRELYAELERDIDGLPPASTLTPEGRRSIVQQHANQMFG